MSAKVYSKSAKRAEHALRATGENRLYLTDAEENTLRKALDEQCDTHKIKGLKLKLIQTVFRQTIGFNKREDDLTGVRLQKLVGSRRDYCNQYVTEMIDQSILIFRRGYYGRILSINYNFDDWGKAPEDVKTQRSEPEKYLENHKPKEQDKPPAQCESEVENHALNTLENPALSAVKDLSINEIEGDFLKHILPDDITHLITQDMLNQLADTLINNLTSLLEQLAPQILQQFIERQAQAEPQTEPQNKPEILAPILVENEVQNPTPIAIQSNDLSEITKPEEVIEPRETPLKPAETKTNLTETAPKDYDALVFPIQLKAYEQTHIKNIIIKEHSDPQNAQLILNSMASRFALDMPPIKSPVAYFRSLLNKFKAGGFESSYADIFTTQRQATQKEQQQDTDQQKRQQYQHKYQAAKHHYKMLKMHAKNSGKTLQQMAKDLDWTALLEEMGFDLDKAQSDCLRKTS